MERYIIENDVKVFGIQVNNFPEGIEQAFGKLKLMLPANDQRIFYGVIRCNSGMDYIAAAEEINNGEAERYECERYVIPKGEHIAITVNDWVNNIPMIKIAFEELGNTNLTDPSRPMLEIYKNMNTMLCAIPVDMRKQIISELSESSNELIQTLSSVSEEKFNRSPFVGSWTPGELAQHLNKAADVVQLLYGPVVKEDRDPGKFVAGIKTTLLDFTTKLDAPEFVQPAKNDYDKEKLLQSLRKKYDGLISAFTELDMNETCTAFPLPATGNMTRLEWAWFIIFHTKRHIHQLKNMISKN